MNNDIYEGLRNALARGYSLKQAMLGFHNAGYKKEEIEEAAKALHEHPSHPLSHPQKPVQVEQKKPLPQKTPVSTTQIQKPKQQTQTSPQQTQVSPIQKPSQPTQLVSKYGEEQKPKTSKWVIIVIIVLFIILSGLVGSLIFQEQIMGFIDNLF